MCQCGHQRDSHRDYEFACHRTPCGCLRFNPAPVDVAPPRVVSVRETLVAQHGYVNAATRTQEQLDRIERKLDWLHDAVLSDPTFRGWPAMFRDWPGSLSQRTPEGTKP